MPSHPQRSETPPRRDAAASDRPQLAIVLAGGSARTAYQAGVLRRLGRHLPQLRFPIFVGISAGAINAAYLASHPGPLGEAAADLCRVWENIEIEDVFRTDPLSLAGNFCRWIARLALGGSRLGPEIRGLVDTSPLRRLLQRELKTNDGGIEGIADNIAAGKLSAIALLTVDYSTGQTVTWVQGSDIEAWERTNRRSHETLLSVEHVMASSALPMLFPAVEIGGKWFGDGGIRLAAPLSPALHLGADRILTISNQYPRSRREADRSSFTGHPLPAQIAGNLLNAVFLDVLDQDVRRLEQLSSLVRKLPPEDRQGLKPVEMLLLRPSQDLGKLCAGFEPRLPRGFRFLTRSLGSSQTKSPDFLSLLMFQPEYLERLIELGERDAEAHLEQVEALVGA